MSTSVQDIMDRMKKQRQRMKLPQKVMGRGMAVSTRVKPLNKQEVAPKAGTANNISQGCGTRKVKDGQGARGMDTKDLEKFIRDKAPQEIKTKLLRMKNKTRLELCKLLAQFPQGRKLLYVETGGKKPVGNMEPQGPSGPENLEAMYAQMNFTLKEQVKNQERQEQKKLRRMSPMLNISPNSSPEANETTNNMNNTNNVNYGNNNGNENKNFKARGMQEAYMMRLASKRVEKDPLTGNLTKFQKQMLAPKPIKNKPKAKSPANKPKMNAKNKAMSFGNNNRRQTIVRAPFISTRTRLSDTQMRNARRSVEKRIDTLKNILKNLKKIKDPSMIQRARVRALTKIVNRDVQKTYNKLLNQEVGKVATLMNLGVITPPRAASPPKMAFSMIDNKGRLNEKRLQKMFRKKAGPVAKVNAEAIKRTREQYNVAMKFMIQGKPCMEYPKKKLVEMAKVFYPRTEGLGELSKIELCQKLRPKMEKILL